MLNESDNVIMSNTKCPKCGKVFDDDLKRYVVGSLTNTVKYATHMTLRIGGGIAGGAFGLGNEMAARAGGRIGKEIAEGIGCGENDFNGWDHKCPSCGYVW